MQWLLIAVALLLSTCTATRAPLTGQMVLQALTHAGASYTDVAWITRPVKSPLPHGYTEQVAFRIPGPPISGGQFFVCDTKAHCDVIYKYLTAFIPIGPPDSYVQSGGGRVVLHLSSSVAADTARIYARAIAALP